MKRKTLRESFEENYTAVEVPAKNARGFKIRYIYYAPWYRWDLSAELLRHEKYAMLFCSMAGFFMTALAMLQRSPLNQNPLVYLPCALMLCCHLMEFMGLLQFLMAKERTTKMNFTDVDRIMRTMPAARGVLGGIAAAICLIFGIFQSDLPIPLAMAAGYGLTAAAALLEKNRYCRIPVVTEKNDSLEKYDTDMKMSAAEDGENSRCP